jgi:hypothetical protein
VTAGIYDYFARACRRTASTDGIAGETIADGEGNTAVFRITLKDGAIQSASYQSTSCVTLVGFCEHLVELVQEREPAAAFELSASKLLELHAEVPEVRRGRAALAVSALHLAVQRAMEEESTK